jgi:nitrogen fixation protein NifU and related proteins
MYKNILLEHQKRPRNFGQLEAGVITQARFVGRGCTISQATGKAMAEAQNVTSAFGTMLRTGQSDSSLGDLNALVGVAKLHTRVKCATLAWQTLELVLPESR